MPYCDECLDAFPFDDDESCLCPSCRDQRDERAARDNQTEENDQ